VFGHAHRRLRSRPDNIQKAIIDKNEQVDDKVAISLDANRELEAIPKPEFWHSEC
jgi:hypothetical protein